MIFLAGMSAFTCHECVFVCSMCMCLYMCVYCESGILSNWCLFVKLANQMAAYNHGVLYTKYM